MYFPALGRYEKDYATYGYDYGTRNDYGTGNPEQTYPTPGLCVIRRRLAQLTPQPTRPIPILIGGCGERRTIPVVAHYAENWHTFDEFRRQSELVNTWQPKQDGTDRPSNG